MSPYTGDAIAFQRGVDTSHLVQIDHVVALKDAWRTGAQQLSGEQRVALANDPVNLLAVDGSSNAQKGDGNTATWLPKAKGFRCEYVARQISVKAAYGLWVVPAEHDAMARILGTCPDQQAYVSTLASTADEEPPASPVSPAEPPRDPMPAPQPPVPSDPAPVDPEPVPSDPAPSDPVPTEPAPTEPAPTEPAPTEPAPSEPAPEDPPSTEQPAPAEPDPSELAPSEPAPGDPAEPSPGETPAVRSAPPLPSGT